MERKDGCNFLYNNIFLRDFFKLICFQLLISLKLSRILSIIKNYKSQLIKTNDSHYDY